MRQSREERKGRNRGLSSRKESGSRRKKAEAERKMLEAKAEGSPEEAIVRRKQEEKGKEEAKAE